MQAYDTYRSDIRSGRRPILVECTDPARSASVESCLFPPSWTEDDARDAFCATHELDASQVSVVRVESEDHATALGMGE